jgi:hypothetical protein
MIEVSYVEFHKIMSKGKKFTKMSCEPVCKLSLKI